ncbi:hypothetical protein BG011_006636 [Mortierella polycephala]|uniref:C2H2-type domain-containing protein n=1 Tax=Mortierella polycephala TaxID=41804 RepID=A0A9P6TZ97_9FUNG|nr:hypothetical protein BG011_006636 [Mortierella polycephala]
MDSHDTSAYPSPSLSPATTFHSNMKQEQPSPTRFSRRRSSVKSLLRSANPPASPLDALVMALEATVEEDAEGFEQDKHAATQTVIAGEVEDEDDPDATIPSSPTMFMKRPSTGHSLHHLPTMTLPESAVFSTSSAQRLQSASLTPSTQPNGPSTSCASQRKMSISSQGSSSSANSNGERTKEYACTIGNCEKRFYQVAHLRSHER